MAGNWRHLYGRRWRLRRAYQLASEPLCRVCKSKGLLTPARVADHIIPHRGDPTLFWGGELQSLCDNCHSSAKQSEEAGQLPPIDYSGANAGDLIVLVGPSRAGKTTWGLAYAEHAGAVLLSLDDVRGPGWTKRAHEAAVARFLPQLHAADKTRPLVVDTTALGSGWRRQLLNVAASTHRRPVAVLFEAPAHVLQARNRASAEPRPTGLVEAMAEQTARAASRLLAEPWAVVGRGSLGPPPTWEPLQYRDSEGVVACAADGYPTCGDW